MPPFTLPTIDDIDVVEAVWVELVLESPEPVWDAWAVDLGGGVADPEPELAVPELWPDCVVDEESPLDVATVVEAAEDCCAESMVSHHSYQNITRDEPVELPPPLLSLLFCRAIKLLLPSRLPNLKSGSVGGQGHAIESVKKARSEASASGNFIAKRFWVCETTAESERT